MAASYTFPIAVQLKNLVSPTDGTDAATKDYVDSGGGGGGGGSYGNANVADYLASNSVVIITTQGNISTQANAQVGNLSVAGTGNTILSTNGSAIEIQSNLYINNAMGNAVLVTDGTAIEVQSNLAVAGNVDIGNNYYLGNGAFLTGVGSSSYGNANVAAYLDSNASINITTQGNVRVSNVFANYYYPNGAPFVGGGGSPAGNAFNIQYNGGSGVFGTFAGDVFSAAANGRILLPTARTAALGVGTDPSNIAGEIRATNDITAFYSSDQNLKSNVEPISNSLLKVRCLRGVRFDWNDDYIQRRGGEDGYFVQRHDIGVIAQEVQQVLPEIVAQRSDGTLAVKYDRLTAVLIEAVKELEREIQELRQEVQQLKGQTRA